MRWRSRCLPLRCSLRGLFASQITPNLRVGVVLFSRVWIILCVLCLFLDRKYIVRFATDVTLELLGPAYSLKYHSCPLGFVIQNKIACPFWLKSLRSGNQHPFQKYQNIYLKRVDKFQKCVRVSTEEELKNHYFCFQTVIIS